MSAPAQQPVAVSLADLKAGTIPLSTLTAAFGPTSLGILLVKDLPAHFPSLRSRVLSNSSYLAALPSSQLQALESPQSKYLTGWSLGRESLKPGVPDTLKGSYYINCAFAVKEGLQASPEKSPAGKDYAGFTEYTTPNLWPDEEETGLVGFREAGEDLIRLVVEVAALVARACDGFAKERVEGYGELKLPVLEGPGGEAEGDVEGKDGTAEMGYLERVVRGSMTTKARLLHYFPPPDASSSSGTGLQKGPEPGDEHQGKDNDQSTKDEEDDDWCATHVDHGCLTGLTSAMYIDESEHPPSLTNTTPIPTSSKPSSRRGEGPLPPLPELSSAPDPDTGLYIHSRAGTVTRVAIPRDCLAFQTGLALEVLTRGQFRAVPHFVRGVGKDKKGVGAKGGKIARNTLAVFTQPNLWEVVDLDKGTDFAGLARRVVDKHY